MGNLGVNSKSQNHLNTDISHERPSLQRQGTFTETRKSRPHSAEYSEYRDQYTTSTNRPLSGPPLARQQSNRTELRSYSTSESEGTSKPTSSLRLSRQTSETRP